MCDCKNHICEKNIIHECLWCHILLCGSCYVKGACISCATEKPVNDRGYITEYPPAANPEDFPVQCQYNHN